MWDVIMTSPTFKNSYDAELVRSDALDRGANWRRAKREARRVRAQFQKSRRGTPREKLPPINHEPLSLWRNRTVEDIA